MRHKNTLSPLKYSLGSLYWLSLLLLLYGNTLFCSLPGMNHAASFRILAGSVIVGGIFSFLLTYKRKRNYLSIVCTLSLAFGPYFLVSFWNINRKPLILAGHITATFTACYTFLVVFNYLRERAEGTSHASGWRCFSACVQADVTISLLVLASLMVITVARPLAGLPIIEAEKRPVLTSISADAEGETISKNMATILLLEETEWSKLDVPARLQVMKTIADIEANYLGIDKLNVCTDVLPEIKLGHYTDVNQTITLNLSHLSNATAHTMLSTLCHECFHAYQHRLIDLFRDLDEDSRQLLLFQKIALYNDEFENYVSGEDDYAAYNAQRCEADSDNYADDAVDEYYYRIYQYNLENSIGKEPTE